MKKLAAFACCLSLLSLTLSGCRGKADKPGRDIGGSAQAAGGQRVDELRFDRLVAGKSDDGERAAEAREWLDPRHKNHAAWKIDKARMLEMANALYAAGAAKVYVIYHPADDTVKVEMCAELLVALPQGAAERQKTIEACNKIERQVWGEDAETVRDSGQKYVALNLDA